MKGFLFKKSPLLALGLENSFDICVRTFGGGLNGQSEAILWIIFIRFFDFLAIMILIVGFFRFFCVTLDAFSLGVARSLCFSLNVEDKLKLRKLGFLTRNSLCKERRSLFPDSILSF